MSGADDLSFTTKISSATTNVLGKSDYFLTLQSLTGATAVTLPDPATVPTGRPFYLQKDGSAQTVTITPAAGNIDGGANVTLATGAVHGRIVISDGTGWWTVAQL